MPLTAARKRSIPVSCIITRRLPDMSPGPSPDATCPKTLGVAWQPVELGLADIDGVTRNQIATFSTRRAEVTTLTDELGLDSAAARASRTSADQCNR